jgi:hypothetical protein
MAREHHKSEQGYRGNPRLSETVGRLGQMRTSGAFASDVVDFPPITLSKRAGVTHTAFVAIGRLDWM